MPASVIIGPLYYIYIYIYRPISRFPSSLFFIILIDQLSILSEDEWVN